MATTDPPVLADSAEVEFKRVEDVHRTRFAEVLGKPARLPAPAFALRFLLGAKADLLLNGQRAVPNALKAAGFRFEFGDMAGALKDLA